MNLSAVGSVIRRYYKQVIMIAVDFLLLSSALLFALWARLGEVWFPDQAGAYAILFACLSVSIFAFGRLGLYRSIIRYMGQQAIFAVLQGVVVSGIILAFASYMSNIFMPRSVPVIYACFAYIFIGGSRVLIRAYYHKGVQIHKERVAIYGAGTSGLQVYKALLHGNDFKPVLFVDDNVSKQGMILDGVPVYSTQNIEWLLERHGISRVLIAMPSVLPQRQQEIIRDLAGRGIAAQIVPGIEDLLDSALRGNDVDSVYDSILGRVPVAPDEHLLDRCIRDRAVLVTGAAGSIGSELCRQILLSCPKTLLMVDINEYGLYRIDQELKQILDSQNTAGIEIIALLGNVMDQRRMSEIIQCFGVQTIYHAAAYKHVPIVENNMLDGIQVNILGTWELVKAAAENAVETFVLISTDKAVRPVSMMGASKRCAELICQAYAYSSAATRFCMVRFGNVLGSSGSVVPLFFDQINAGGPVTVTHPDVVRYFMTISEAAQLVLQAGSMGEGGEVFVLDMGKPVKIMDLAERMISLLGHTVKSESNPEGDIDISIIGLRPGEKLYEELVLGDKISGTGHAMIMRADEGFLELPNLLVFLDKLSQGCSEGDCQMIKNILSEVVGGFFEYPIHDVVWQRSERTKPPSNDDPSAAKASVTPLLRRSGKTTS